MRYRKSPYPISTRKMVPSRDQSARRGFLAFAAYTGRKKVESNMENMNSFSTSPRLAKTGLPGAGEGSGGPCGWPTRPWARAAILAVSRMMRGAVR